MKTHVTELTLASFFTALALAAAEPGNLFRDPDLKSPDAWNAPENVQSKPNTPSAGETADSANFLAGKGRTTLQQKLSVKPDTWYILSFRFRSLGKYADPPRQPYNLMAGILPEGATSIWSPALASRTFGGAPVWNSGRVIFHSGKNSAVTPFAAFFGDGEWSISGLALREISEKDFQQNGVLDPGFETALPGMIPTDFRPTRSKGGKAAVTVSDQARTGKQVLEISFQGKFELIGSRFLLRAGETYTAGVYLKASAPVSVEMGIMGATPGNRTRSVRKAEIGTQWTRVEVKGVVRKNEGPVSALQLNLSFQAKDNAETTVWCDDVTFEHSAPAK